jgi:two-component system NtrC family response regulator
LIQGETGTGKEVLARYIHAVSHRSERPFLAFNCGAFTETLLESELFGHEKGSFTGAGSRKKGIFELAHRGTLFLDEIDSASSAIQVKLLRVLESGEFLRVGGEELCKVDVRIIAATNAYLQLKVENNQFREDLFYRLDVASLFIPPLRERTEDIPLFINYFLDKEIKAKGTEAKRFSEEALEILMQYSWPGNIRELANTVAQTVLLSNSPIIRTEDLPQRIIKKYREESGLAQETPSETQKEEAAPLPEDDTAPEYDLKPVELFHSHPRGKELEKILAQFEELFLKNLTFKQGFALSSFQDDLKGWHSNLIKKIITEALQTTYGNQLKAAKLLNITPRALRYYLKEKQKP